MNRQISQLFGVVAILFALLQRFLLRGMALGSVK